MRSTAIKAIFRCLFQLPHGLRISAALEQEKQNTASIHDLYKLAQSLNDFATQSHLQWFLDEQVEEEKIFDEALALLDMAGDDASALLMLNEKLGQRVGAPADTGGTPA